MKNCEMFKTIDDARYAYNASSKKDKLKIEEWLYEEYDCRDFGEEEFRYVMSKDNFKAEGGIQFPCMYNVIEMFDKQNAREAFILDDLVNGVFKDTMTMVPRRFFYEFYGLKNNSHGSLINNMSRLFKQYNIVDAHWSNNWYVDFQKLNDKSKWDMKGIRKFVDKTLMEYREEKARKEQKAFKNKGN